MSKSNHRMKEMFDLLVHRGVTPNELYTLYARDQDVYHRNYLPGSAEVDSLRRKGLLTDIPDIRLTSSASLLLGEVDALFITGKKKKTVMGAAVIEQIEQYRLLFPTGLNQVKKPFRTSVKELIPRFEWFFLQYPEYDMDLILEVTDIYNMDRANDPSNLNNKYTRTAGYFVKKQDLDKTWVSDLASFCQQKVEGGLEPIAPMIQNHIAVRA